MFWIVIAISVLLIVGITVATAAFVGGGGPRRDPDDQPVIPGPNDDDGPLF